MTLGSMLEMEREWKYAWIKRTIEHMEEQEKQGCEYVKLHPREFQHILSQLLSALQHSDRLEEVLISYARCAFPTQQIIAPNVFGGNNNECLTATGAQIQKDSKKDS